MIKEISPKKERQGDNSPRVLIILVVSLCLAFGLLLLLYVAFFTGSYPENPLNDANRPTTSAQP